MRFKPGDKVFYRYMFGGYTPVNNVVGIIESIQDGKYLFKFSFSFLLLEESDVWEYNERYETRSNAGKALNNIGLKAGRQKEAGIDTTQGEKQMPSNDVQRSIYPENTGIRPAYKNVMSDVHSEETNEFAYIDGTDVKKPTIEFLIDEICPHSPLLDFNKQRLLKLIETEKADAIREARIAENQHHLEDVRKAPESLMRDLIEKEFTDRIQSLNKEGEGK